MASRSAHLRRDEGDVRAGAAARRGGVDEGRLDESATFAVIAAISFTKWRCQRKGIFVKYKFSITVLKVAAVDLEFYYDKARWYMERTR